MSQYQGHLSDGSSIQRHSAGGLYPFILFGKETPRGLQWGFITPGGREVLIGSYAAAADLALAVKNGSERGRILRQLRSLETLSGEPREEPAPTDTDWFTRRDFDCWYDGLIRSGTTTQEEINALQRVMCDRDRGVPVSAERVARYEELRNWAAFCAA